MAGGCRGYRNTGTEDIVFSKTSDRPFFFVCFFLCWRLSCVKILPTSYMKKESLDKEKPCNVVLNIYIYIYLFLYIYNIAVTI